MYVADKLQAAASSDFVKRQFYGGYYGNNRYYSSGWYSYGRWILLGVIVGLAVLSWLIICGCNRRRTRRGYGPVKYTGWATPGFTAPQQTGTTQGQYPMQSTNTYPAAAGNHNNTTGGANAPYNYNQPSQYPQPNNTYSNQTYYNAPQNAPPTYYQPPTSAAPAREK